MENRPRRIRATKVAAKIKERLVFPSSQVLVWTEVFTLRELPVIWRPEAFEILGAGRLFPPMAPIVA